MNDAGIIIGIKTKDKKSNDIPLIKVWLGYEHGQVVVRVHFYDDGTEKCLCLTMFGLEMGHEHPTTPTMPPFTVI